MKTTKHLIQVALFVAIVSFPSASNAQSPGRADSVPQMRRPLVDSALALINYFDFDRAMECAERLLSVSESKFGVNSIEYAKALDISGEIYYCKGDFENAANYYKRSYELKKLLGETASLSSAKSLNNLAVSEQMRGGFHNSTEFLSSSIEIKKNTLGESDSSYLISVHNLANAFLEIDELERASDLFATLLPAKAKIFGAESPSYARSLMNQGVLREKLGATEDAQKCYETALRILRKNMPDERVEVQKCALQLSEVLIKLGQEARADTLLKSINRNIEKSESSTPFDRGLVLYSMAVVEWQKGNFYKSDELLAKAEDLLATSYKSTLLYCDVIVARAAVNSALSKYDRALQYAVFGEKLYRELFGERHPSYASSLHILAGIQRNKGMLAEADTNYHKAFVLYTKQINDYFPFLSDGDKAQFYFAAKDRANIFNNYALSRYEKNPAILCDMYDFHIATKSMLLSNSLRRNRAVLASGDDEAIEQFNEWRSLRNKLSSTLCNNPRDTAKISELSDEIGKLEIELSRETKKFDTENFRQYSWKDIQATLSPQEAVVEIVRFPLWQNRWTDSVFYCALVLTAETKNEPMIVVIENGYQLEHKYINSYKNIIRSRIENQLDNEPYKVFWSAIDAITSKYKKLYVSLDGIFNQLNLNTILRPDGSYIIDGQEIVLLNNSRELLEKPTAEAGPSRTAALFGNPNFSLNSKPASERSVRLDPLPFTKVEVERIDTMLNANGWTADLFLGDKATSKNITELQSPRLLHIATHGVFEQNIDSKKRTLFGGLMTSGCENPLLRSYLLFSGAESSLAEGKKGDGVLTAFDAMNLSLENTDLVVLSACQTGLGDIRNGEGVFGLQRAFRVAGAKAVIMSLWTVNDESTQELMNEFYAQWLKGSSLQDAFRSAQLKIKEKYPEPYFWGPFVIAGGN